MGKANSNIGLEPMDNRIIIRPDASETVTKGGIIIPDDAKEAKVYGTVVAHGAADTVTLKVGDRVLYGKFSGQEVDWDGIEYKVMREVEIIAKISLNIPKGQAKVPAANKAIMKGGK